MKVSRQVAGQGLLVLPHDDPGAGAADEVTAVEIFRRCLRHGERLKSVEKINDISDRSIAFRN
jgi:hypothetical protein